MADLATLSNETGFMTDHDFTFFNLREICSVREDFLSILFILCDLILYY